MKFRSILLILALSILLGALVSFPQAPTPPRRPGSPSGDVRLPSGRLQRDEMVKADHEKNLEDARALIKLAEELKSEIAKNTEHVLSVGTIKKTEEIEKIARRMRSRMKRY
jgi:hypothetical protein